MFFFLYTLRGTMTKHDKGEFMIQTLADLSLPLPQCAAVDIIKESFFFFFSMTLLKSIPHKEGMGTQILQLNTYYSNIKGKTRGKVQCR